MTKDYLLQPEPPNPIEFPIEHFDWIRENHPNEPALFLLTGQAGTGKAQPHYSKVLTPSGWVAISTLTVGDELFAADGTVTTLTGIFPQGKKKVNQVVFNDGSYAHCCNEHLWLTKTTLDRNAGRLGTVKTLDTIKETFWARPKVSTHLNHSIPLVKPIEFAEKNYKIHPYLLGVLLGDGCITTGVSITNPEIEIISRLREVTGNDIAITTRQTQDRCGAYGVTGITQELIRLELAGCGADTKYIPQEYLLGSVDQRIDLLRGLMDTDGTVSNNGIEVSLSTASSKLANDLISLVNSLGGIARISIKPYPKYKYKGELKTGLPAHIVSICLPPEINPFYLSRKATKVVPKTKHKPQRLFSRIEELPEEEECYCISIAHSDQLYITDNYVVTHNTYLTRQAIQANPTICKLSASTGIAAVNLGDAVTIHSLLKVFNEISIERAQGEGYVQTILRKLRDTYDFIAVDEGCMLNDRFCSALFLALDEINRGDEKRLGIILIGDFAQLPPIPYTQTVNGVPVINPSTMKETKQKKIPWLFNNADLNKVLRLPGHTIRLLEIKRQSDPIFIEALNNLRVGNGLKGAQLLKQAGVHFIDSQNPDFEGTTLLSKNDEVDRYNRMRLMRFQPEQEIIRLKNYRWFGAQNRPGNTIKNPGAWDTIPDELELKIGAYVMLLNNAYDVNRELVYGNGDTGVIERITATPRIHEQYKDLTEDELQAKLDLEFFDLRDLKPKHTYETPFADLITHDYQIYVRLRRAGLPEGKLVCVSMIQRDLQSVTEPGDENKRHPRFPTKDGKPAKVATGASGEKSWIDGQILYYPIRLAWFSTCHKAQGLTFDTVQIDISNRFFSQPAMVYTAVSRCRTPQGLYIVGSPMDLAAKTAVSKEITEWI